MTTNIDKDITMKKYLAVLRRPIFFIIINFFLVNIIFSLLSDRLGNAAYDIGRICIIFYAGRLVTGKNIGGIWQSALAGTFIYFTDHVLLKGGVFILNYLFKPEGPGLAAFSGVIVSFIMFTPLAMLIGAMGGLFARSRRERP